MCFGRYHIRKESSVSCHLFCFYEEKNGKCNEANWGAL